MHKQDGNELYEQMEQMLYLLVNRMTSCRQCDIEDRMTVARIGFAKAYNKFDPDRGIAFSTVLWVYVRNELIAECRKCLRRKQNGFKAFSSVDFPILNKPSPPTFWDRFADLSNEARQVIELVCMSSKEFTSMGFKDSPGLLRCHLAKLGWSSKQVRLVFKEVREALEV